MTELAGDGFLATAAGWAAGLALGVVLAVTATMWFWAAVLVLAFGARKAEAVARALGGPMTAELPASLLQSAAGRVAWMIDEAAAGGLG